MCRPPVRTFKTGTGILCILFFMCAVMRAVHLEQTSQVHTYHALSRGQVVLIREDFDKPTSCSTGVIVNVRESSDNIVRSATVKIGDKTYNRPIQRLYELKNGIRVNLLMNCYIWLTLRPLLRLLTIYILEFQKPQLNRLERWSIQL